MFRMPRIQSRLLYLAYNTYKPFDMNRGGFGVGKKSVGGLFAFL